MNIPVHSSESLEKIFWFWVKNTYILDSLMRIRDPESFGLWIPNLLDSGAGMEKL
jgi:hypothetical protein